LSNNFIRSDAVYHRWSATPIAAAIRRLVPRHVYAKDEVDRLANDWHQAPDAELISAIKLKSMLHEKTLSLLHHFAGKVRGAILEIGPYTGGSTIAMATALRDGVPLITIEMGGSYEQHPHLPSADILGDLDANLREFGVRERVTIINGVSSAPATVCQVESRLAGRRIDLLFIDADGQVGRDFAAYRPFLAKRAIIALDDFETPDAEAARLKQEPVRAFVAEAVGAGLARELGVFPWGTWFGQCLSR